MNEREHDATPDPDAAASAAAQADADDPTGALMMAADNFAYSNALDDIARLVNPPGATEGLSLNATVDRVREVVRERDELLAAWPGCNGNAGPVLYHHSDGSWWLETVAGDRWKRCEAGPYPSRQDAIRAAITPPAPAG